MCSHYLLYDRRLALLRQAARVYRTFHATERRNNSCAAGHRVLRLPFKNHLARNAAVWLPLPGAVLSDRGIDPISTVGRVCDAVCDCMDRPVLWTQGGGIGRAHV